MSKPLLVSCGADCTVRVWDYRAWQCQLVSQQPEGPLGVALHPDGMQLLLAFKVSVRARARVTVRVTVRVRVRVTFTVRGTFRERVTVRVSIDHLEVRLHSPREEVGAAKNALERPVLKVLVRVRVGVGVRVGIRVRVRVWVRVSAAASTCPR